MSDLPIRWVLLLVLFLDWSDLLDFAEQAAVPSQRAYLIAPLVFFPLALRYREEAVRRIRLACRRWLEKPLLIQAYPSLACPVSMPVLTPSLAMARLQP